MKLKAYRTLRRNIILYVGLCLLFLTSGCGLDVYYVLPSPYDTNHEPNYNSNYGESYFEFFTNESGFENDGGLKFQGTEVYYKIYSSYSTMTSQVSTLQSLASSDDTSTTASTRLITTYTYKPLAVKDSTESPLIPYKGTNQRVYIRLTDYLDMEEFSAKILADDEYLYDSESKTVPVRNISEKKTFNFGRTGDNDAVPKSDDEDVNYTTVSETNKWYVAMFAVAVGVDYLYTSYPSNILYLGSVTIDSSSENN
ncbi:MAG: hypothetical protein K5681_10835 [Treponema sp.]|nr:hypothetical protein [Treponema sp.]